MTLGTNSNLKSILFSETEKDEVPSLYDLHNDIQQTLFNIETDIPNLFFNFKLSLDLYIVSDIQQFFKLRNKTSFCNY